MATGSRRGFGTPLLPYPGKLLRDILLFNIIALPVMISLTVNTILPAIMAFASLLVLNLNVLVILRFAQIREWRLRADYVALRSGINPADTMTEIGALHAVLGGLDLPVLILDKGRRVSFFNGAARDLLGRMVAGKDVAGVIRNPEFLSAADEVLRDSQSTTVEFRRLQPVSRLLRARIEALPDSASSETAFIVMLDDLTDSERMREVRSDFVADVSHELRTPLATVISIVETLNGAARDDSDAQQKFLTMLDEQAARMAGIVDDLLSLSRIEMNEHHRPDGTADLRKVVEQIATSARLLAGNKDMTIDLFGETALMVIGDALELSRVFQNLIDNAVNYGKPGTAIRIEMKTAGRLAVVSVSDQGPGIEEHHVPRLTERFYRVDKGRSRAAGGTGLGLAIVKHVINRHRGRLKIESEVGTGSTFTVELPLASLETD